MRRIGRCLSRCPRLDESGKSACEQTLLFGFVAAEATMEGPHRASNGGVACLHEQRRTRINARSNGREVVRHQGQLATAERRANVLDRNVRVLLVAVDYHHDAFLRYPKLAPQAG